MTTNLLQKLNTLNGELHDYVMLEFINIKICAENMAECATNMKGHGYAVFMAARNEFFAKIDALQKYLEKMGV